MMSRSQNQEEGVLGRELSMKREKQIMWSLCGVIGVYWVSGDLDLIVAPETLCLIWEHVCLSLSTNSGHLDLPPLVSTIRLKTLKLFFPEKNLLYLILSSLAGKY